jgi:hypothetical protein
MTTSPEEARRFIMAAPLPMLDVAVAQGAEAAPSTPFEAGAAQATIINSGVVAFPANTPVEIRQAVADSMLFAQLYADHEVSDRNDVESWMNTYFAALPKLGWVLASDSGADTEENAQGSELHQKILEFLAVALGPATTALALVTSALLSLQAMGAGSPWITLFNRRAKDARAAGINVTHAEADGTGNVSLKGAGFRVQANQQITQVLFFKFTSNAAKLYRRTVEMTMVSRTLTELAPDIHGRVAQYARDSILNMPIGEGAVS